MSKHIIREYCGDCLKCFTSADWADLIRALLLHKQTCPKARK